MSKTPLSKRQIFSLVSLFLFGLVWCLILISPKLAEPLYYPALFEPSVYPSGNWQNTKLSGIERRDCYFATRDGKILNGWLFEKPGATKTILLSHGRGGNLTEYLDL